MSEGAYLLRTLESQPRELARLLADDSAARAAERLQDAGRIFLVGTGTSFHGALAGQYMLRGAGREAWADPLYSATYVGGLLNVRIFGQEVVNTQTGLSYPFSVTSTSLSDSMCGEQKAKA